MTTQQDSYFNSKPVFSRFLHIITVTVFSLMKNYTARPNYSQLLELDFIREYAQKDMNVAEFVGEILDLPENEQPV